MSSPEEFILDESFYGDPQPASHPLGHLSIYETLPVHLLRASPGNEARGAK